MAQESSVGDATAKLPFREDHRVGTAQKLKKSFSSVVERVLGAGNGFSGAEAGPHSGAAESEKESLVSSSADAKSPRKSGIARSTTRERIDSSSPEVSHRDFAERIMDKLPGAHTNPYSMGHPTQPQAPAGAAAASDPYVTGKDAASPAKPATKGRHHHTARFMSKMWTMVTGRKPAQEPASPTTEKKELMGEKEGYAQDPSPKEGGDFYEKAKEKLAKVGHKGTSTSRPEELAWPAPAKPDYHDKPGATYTTEEGHPIEGPTQPKEQDTKKEGPMTKVMDLHMHHSTGSAPSPNAAAATTEASAPPAEKSVV